MDSQNTPRPDGGVRKTEQAVLYSATGRPEELMLFLHISPRTLQTLRDNRMIAFTTIGGKILYPERELQKVLLDNLQPVEPPF